MKRKTPLAFLFGWFALALTPGHTTQAADALAAAPIAPQTGTLAGRISNAATGKSLAGARVELQGTGRSVATNEDGEYRFFEVPAGAKTVSVSYTGLETQVVAVAIEPGSSTRRDVGLTADVYTLSPFVVTGEREGNALAITLQRESDGIRNVVSADAFGNLAGNPADLLIRMPGIVGESVGGDMRYVRIRGMNSLLSTVTSDGNRMADAASAGATREYQFQQVNSDTIERIEVVKSPTPDLDADSIGGAVNMVSKSAFDVSPGRRMGFSAGAIWRVFDDRDEPHRNYTFSYSEVFNGRLGVAFNYGHRAHTSLIDRTNQAHRVQLEDPAYTYGFEFHDSRNTRTRWGGGLKLDFKLSDNSRFYLNNTLSKHSEYSNTNIAVFSTAQTVATRDANGNLTGTGAIVPGFTKDVTEWRSVTNSTAELTAAAGAKYGRTLHSQLGGVHRYPALEIDYNAYLSNSVAKYEKGRLGNFALTARGIGLRIERKDEPYFPLISQTSGPDMTNIASYTGNLLTLTDNFGEDEYAGAALNVKKSFSTVVPTWIKAGVRYRAQTRDLSNQTTRTSWVGADGVQGVNPATGINDDNLARFANPKVESPVRGGRYPKLPYPARAFREQKGSSYDYWGYNIGTALRETPQFFQDDIAFNTMTALVGDQRFNERIAAAYIVGNIDLGKLRMLGGLRVEDTAVDGTGALQAITPAERARRAAWVGPVTRDEQLRRVTAEYSGRRTATGENRGVFPGLHFKYEPVRGLVTRLSYATNIGRPGIGQLIPRTTVNYEARTVSTNNPSLKPQYANNFDASIEYYFEPIGLFSAGVFLKEIKEFIFTAGGQPIGTGADNGFDGEYAGFTLTSQSNGGFAKIRGLELAYQQQFSFLGGWLGGFGVFANYTKLETEGDYGAAVVRSTNEVAGFTPETGNIGISYIRGRTSLRFQFNHVGKYLVTFNANQAALLYRMARSTVDLKTRYTLSKRFDLYLDIDNVFAEADRASVFYTGRPQDMFKMSPQFNFGINGRL
jgi:TonB-dependent receptor